MGLKFLFNAAGAAATAVNNTGSGALAPGYNTADIITGPRSTAWRSTSATANSIGYVYSSTVAISHVVVARADWLVTKAGQRVKGRQRAAGGTWSDIPGFDLNPLASSSLIGPRSQDLVVASTPTDLYGIGLSFTPASGSEAAQLSKLYGTNAFSFADAAPSLGVSSRGFEPGTYQAPLRGTMPYEVEREFTLQFVGISRSELTALLAVTNLYHWPFFVYDSAQEIWQWKLEHVLLADLQATPISPVGDYYRLDLQLYRLRHYD